MYAFQISPILAIRPARLILPNSITIMMFGREHNVCLTHAARMLLAEQNERNVVIQLKEMLRLSPALYLSLSLTHTHTHKVSLYHSLSHTRLLSHHCLFHSRVLSLHSKLLLALRCSAVVSPHTLLPSVQTLLSAECTHRTRKRFIYTVVMAALTASTLCPLLPAPLAQDNQPKAHFTIKIYYVVINMIPVNGMARRSERKYAAEGGGECNIWEEIRSKSAILV